MVLSWVFTQGLYASVYGISSVYLKSVSYFLNALYLIKFNLLVLSFNILLSFKKDLPNFTWHEVQEKLLKMQPKLHLCIHKQKISELDIYNRILRFKNYQVAMVNQGLLPPRVEVPIFGKLYALFII